MDSGGLAEIVELAYRAQPSSLLYHYTSLDGVLAIAPSGTLWATGHPLPERRIRTARCGYGIWFGRERGSAEQRG